MLLYKYYIKNKKQKINYTTNMLISNVYFADGNAKWYKEFWKSLKVSYILTYLSNIYLLFYSIPPLSIQVKESLYLHQNLYMNIHSIFIHNH
jgi:hypothetical protein